MLSRLSSALPLSVSTRSLIVLSAVAVAAVVSTALIISIGHDAEAGATPGSEPSPVAMPSLVHPPAEDAMTVLKERAAERRTDDGGRIVAAGAGTTQQVPAPEPERSVWDRLADCESGDWNGAGTPVPGSAQWDYGVGRSTRFEGGLQFAPGTWEGFRDAGMPGDAGLATRTQQITVAERVLDAQGWGAWPVCSRKLGLR